MPRRHLVPGRWVHPNTGVGTGDKSGAGCLPGPRVNPRFMVTAMSLDRNKRRTYKNTTATTEVLMLTFVKDLMAFLALGGFSVASLTWMDIAARLV